MGSSRYGPKTMPNMIHKPPNLEPTMCVERLAVVHDVQQVSLAKQKLATFFSILLDNKRSQT
jgi:hypothetical protein